MNFYELPLCYFEGKGISAGDLKYFDELSTVVIEDIDDINSGRISLRGCRQNQPSRANLRRRIWA